MCIRDSLFQTHDEAQKLDPKTSEKFHHLTAKLLYLGKRARPDIQLAVAFLCTRVAQPNIHDWKKLKRCLQYLQANPTIPLVVDAADPHHIKWWVDASFAVHKDMKSHTGATMTIGKGAVFSMSTRQRLNTKSSTEATLVGVDDAMPMVVWTRHFLQDQGYDTKDNVVYQDNQSAILLERNGMASSGRRTRHINIRYFFVHDRIKNGDLRVEYCPTDQMVADFFTKPTQGAAFKRMRDLIMNNNQTPSGNERIASQECVGARRWADVAKGNNPMTDATALATDANKTKPRKRENPRGSHNSTKL